PHAPASGQIGEDPGSTDLLGTITAPLLPGAPIVPGSLLPQRDPPRAEFRAPARARVTPVTSLAPLTPPGPVTGQARAHDVCHGCGPKSLLENSGCGWLGGGGL